MPAARPPERKRRWWIALIVLLLFVIGGHEYDKRRFETGDRGFSRVTGMNLPANVTATAHAGEVSDAPFHTRHYWMLRGPAASLLELAPKPRFQPSSSGNANEVLHGARNSLALDVDAELIAGFEDDNGGRARWLLVLTPGDRAIYAW